LEHLTRKGGGGAGPPFPSPPLILKEIELPAGQARLDSVPTSAFLSPGWNGMELALLLS
jgi:hypothetical protein